MQDSQDGGANAGSGVGPQGMVTDEPAERDSAAKNLQDRSRPAETTEKTVFEESNLGSNSPAEHVTPEASGEDSKNEHGTREEPFMSTSDRLAPLESRGVCSYAGETDANSLIITTEEKYKLRELPLRLQLPVSRSSSLLGSPTTPSSLEKRCRTAKSLLEEAEAKGTLVERVQMLENRLNQHSLILEKIFSNGGLGLSRSDTSRLDVDPSEAASEHSEGMSGGELKPGVMETGNAQVIETPLHGNDHEVSPEAVLPLEKGEEVKMLADDATDKDRTNNIAPSSVSQTGAGQDGIISNHESTGDGPRNPLLGKDSCIDDHKLASETSTAAPSSEPVDPRGMQNVVQSETAPAATKELQPMDSLEGGAVNKPTTVSAKDRGDESSSLAHKEVEHKAVMEETKAPAAASVAKADYVKDPQPLSKKEKKKKEKEAKEAKETKQKRHHFQNMRQRFQRVFGSKQAS